MLHNASILKFNLQKPIDFLSEFKYVNALSVHVCVFSNLSLSLSLSYYSLSLSLYPDTSATLFAPLQQSLSAARVQSGPKFRGFTQFWNLMLVTLHDNRNEITQHSLCRENI